MENVDKALLKETLLEVLTEAGLISPNISRQEAIAMIGRHRYEKAYKGGILPRMKREGRNATVEVNRGTFMQLLHSGRI